MTTVEAIAMLTQLLATATNLMANAQAVSALIQKAQAEGRTTFTAEEWATIQGADNAGRAALVAAISAALAK